MSNPVTKVAAEQQKVKPSLAPLLTMPPPPPPPPLPCIPSRSSTTKKAPTLVEFYQTLTKCEGRKDARGPGIPNNRMPNYAHNSIVGEIQNLSSHLLAIKSDIETKGEFIKLLIEKIHSAAYTDIEDVLQFPIV
ncbi:hypothetical protein AQUCO_05500135v1 [Aquilegia coerulea]|uniref:Uncharacterized protein n=1 Tax=Aquilegia coerulea TaxID=218851 RepID=A0A2G5CH23_AQUCA|nr:hypothetical protein AQUCO_05500135v1 [Aquilegia coerulea]PIA30606.1 hypothetical protein AQUCO_05500135v1 [Aquilegia coerulea]